MNEFTAPEVVHALIELLAVAAALGAAAGICFWLLFDIHR